MVGIGIVGCGSIVRMRHAPECSKNPNIVIKGNGINQFAH